jgi:hypothetical protein
MSGSAGALVRKSHTVCPIPAREMRGMFRGRNLSRAWQEKRATAGGFRQARERGACHGAPVANLPHSPKSVLRNRKESPAASAMG